MKTQLNAKSLRWLFLIIVFFAATTSCAPIDPRTQAEADKTATESRQAALDAEQARAQQQAEWQLEQAKREALVKEWVAAWKAILPVFMAALAFAIVGISVGVTSGVSIAAVQMGMAAGESARLAAKQIPVSPKTFSFPLLVSPDGKYLLDLNTRTAMYTGDAAEPNRDMVASYRSRAEIALENYQAAHAMNGSKVIISETQDLE
jgi:hypothetical protein